MKNKKPSCKLNQKMSSSQKWEKDKKYHRQFLMSLWPEQKMFIIYKNLMSALQTVIWQEQIWKNVVYGPCKIMLLAFLFHQ